MSRQEVGWKVHNHKGWWKAPDQGHCDEAEAYLYSPRELLKLWTYNLQYHYLSKPRLRQVLE